MIRCKVIRDFTYMPATRFKELKITKRTKKDTIGKLYIGDIFECSYEVAEYLAGKNTKKDKVVRIIEVCPDSSIFKNKD